MADQVAAGGLLSPFLRQMRVRAAMPHIRGRVLDVGCGTGELAKYFCNDGYWGVDIDEESLRLAQANYPHCRFSKELPNDEVFDTIVGLAVIEHVKEITHWLTELRQRLAPAGRIVLTTPHKNMEGVHRIGSMLGLFSKEAADEHEVLFDKALMCTSARQAGLELYSAKKFLLGANQLFILFAK